MNKFFHRSFIAQWIPWAVGLTLVFCAMYGISRQMLRQSANDPQIQIAEDTAAAINAGEPAAVFNSQTKTDIATSLSPYLVIYDANGAIVASTALLNGAPLAVPQNVLRSAFTKNESRTTWQPQSGVRSAIVIVPVKGIFNGFVVAGRSLRETENRENNIGLMALAAWFVSLIALFGTFAFLEYWKIKRQ